MSHLLYFLLSLCLFNLIVASTNFTNFKFPGCPSYNCNGVMISYPFWENNSITAGAPYCGYKGFGLNCPAGGEPILSLPEQSYYVKNIDYTDRTINLVDIDVVTEDCPRARHNLTLDSVPLYHQTQSEMNLTFYFNCSSTPSSAASVVPCFDTYNGRMSYVINTDDDSEGNDWWEKCVDKVLVTVMEDQIKQGNLLTAFGTAMKNGVSLDWGNLKDCATCEDSGGRCGNDYMDDTKFLCFCEDGGNTSTHCNVKGPNTGKKIAIGISAAMLAGILIFCTICCFKSKQWLHSLVFCMKNRNTHQNIEAFIRDYQSLAPKRYIYSDIKKMTNFFKDKLGQGGYGGVYKGKLPDGRLVAVKVLNSAKGNGEEFMNEVASISRTSHVNIVALMGFCFEGSKRALIYEFMPNGSLEKFICNDHSLVSSSHLGVELLYRIAVGIAQGLGYLHRGCSTRILHFDIKPHNILLDDDFVPKISDFGLAKLCPSKESIISMMDARGTIGYVAPEVFSRNFGGVSHKSDVYSYGMMILEMVGGKRNINAGLSHSSDIYFPHWIYKRLEHSEDLGFHSSMTVEENEIAKRMIVVGLWCIQTDPSHRPSMSKVIDMLEGNNETLKVPPKPFLSSPPRLSLTNSFTESDLEIQL